MVYLERGRGCSGPKGQGTKLWGKWNFSLHTNKDLQRAPPLGKRWEGQEKFVQPAQGGNEDFTCLYSGPWCGRIAPTVFVTIRL